MNAQELATIREWVTWDPPTDTDIEVQMEQTNSVYATALHFVRVRRSQLAELPTSWSADGYSESRSLKGFDGMIVELQALYDEELADAETSELGTGSAMTAARLTRIDAPGR